ncbi:MAG: hypothetical protein E4H36_04145 [Spirochaetales bacterium]|nr:MAG: hypothetical protein E4H36_04145 [Spirochaetales bacterium]
MSIGSLSAAAVNVCLLFFSQFPALLSGGENGEGGPRTCSRRGAYGVVRHPGFWWFFFMIGFLNIAFRQTEVLEISCVLVLINLLFVILEDTVIFPKLFSDYTDYRKGVPFLIPRLVWRLKADAASE